MPSPSAKLRRRQGRLGAAGRRRNAARCERAWLTSLCDDIAALRKAGTDVILVSSGAIALGRRALKLKPGALRLEESQAAAAAGQVRLAQAYADTFAELGIVAAQILLTLDDTEERRRYLNARATLNTLLELGSVPVINENDTVATAEIRFGDNDRLAARVASMMGADRLVLLSDVDGLYTADPTADADARHIADVNSHHARDRSHGRRLGLRRRTRRHGLQAHRRQDRDPGRLRCAHRQGQDGASAGGDPRRRACHALPRLDHAGRRAQALDRRRAQGRRRAARR